MAMATFALRSQRKILGQSKKSGFRPQICIISVLVLTSLVVYIAADYQPYVDTSLTTLNTALSTLSGSSAFDVQGNMQAMEDWRTSAETDCQRMIDDAKGNFGDEARNQKRSLEREAVERLSIPSSPSASLPSGHRKYEHCRNVFIDLGTNIGDSIGYFVDNALDVCSPMWLEKSPKTRLDKQFPRPHLDVTELKIFHEGYGSNPLYALLQTQMNKDPSNVVHPESFCVYGMEGNPEFTSRLQKLENYVLDMRPRPVQRLHIHTESVVTADDGPTKLYLDKTSVAENFWGSSILSSQQDAKKSAKELGNGTVFSADVDGISLSTLVKNTALPYKPEASTEEQVGGILIIKMDIEGAEYQVLKEVAKTGVLCDYVKKGNRVVFIVEYHNMSITDPEERRREKDGSMRAKEQLEQCGVEFGKLHAFWH